MGVLDVLIQKDTLSVSVPRLVYQPWFTPVQRKVSLLTPSLEPVVHSNMPKAHPPHANSLGSILARL